MNTTLFKFSQTARALSLASSVTLLSMATLAQTAPVKVEGAWARAMVQGQQSTGAFMGLTAKEALALVGVSSSIAGVAEVHEMKMEGDIMKMRAVPTLDLPAGKKVDFKPGGYHIMLMDLKTPLALGSTVPVTLTFKDAKGVQSKLALKLPVSTVAPGALASEPAATHKHKH